MLHVLNRAWRWRPLLAPPLLLRPRFATTRTIQTLPALTSTLPPQLPPPNKTTCPRLLLPHASTPPPHAQGQQKQRVQLDAGSIDIQAVQRRLRDLGFDQDLFLVSHPRHRIHTRWATVKLFLDEGFTAEQMSTLLGCRRVLDKPYLDLVSWMEFLKTLDATNEIIVEFLTTRSPVNTLRVETLKRKLEVLESFGYDPEKLKKMVIHRHWLATISVDTLRRRLRWLQDFGVDMKGIRKIVRLCPRVLTLNSARNLRPKIAFLESQGASRAAILRAMKTRPALFTLCRDSMLQRIEQYQQLGIGKDAQQLLDVFFQLSTVSSEQVAERFHWLVGRGLSPDQVRQLVVTFPLALSRSEGSTAKKIDFLTKVLNRDIKELLKFPQFLGLSLENRIIPRSKLVADAKEQGKLEREASLWTVLRLTDIQFQKWLARRGMNAGKTSEEIDQAMGGPKQVKEAG